MITLYNHKTQENDALNINAGEDFWIYLCGPTVYHRVHLGNLRGLIVYDILRRWLELSGTSTKLCVNITDIDDKIIEIAKKNKSQICEITHGNMLYFFKIYFACNLLSPTITPTVTANMDHIIATIERMKNSYVLTEKKDSLIFTGKESLNNSYGVLSKRKEKKIEFAVWKAEEDLEISWNSKLLGRGRPGWHTECVSLITRYCKNLKIHCGGIDLIFPHHENELIQLNALGYKTDEILFSYVGQLLFRGEKMSKSLMNTVEADSVIDLYGINALKYFFIKTRYSSPIYMESVDELAAAKSEINKILYPIKYNFSSDLENRITMSMLPIEFINSLEKNLNTVEALMCVRHFISTADSVEKWSIAHKMVEILGFDIKSILTKKEANTLLEDIVSYNEVMRKEKLYEFSDHLRGLLEKNNIKIYNK